MAGYTKAEIEAMREGGKILAQIFEGLKQQVKPGVSEKELDAWVDAELLKELGALAGFEKSGHYFLAEPIGRGYDCGMRVAVEVCKLMDRNPGKSMADLRRALPRTWATPTMSPYCPDGEKYGVVTRLAARLEAMAADGAPLAGQLIERIVTVNGARVMLANGAWGLIRASSNTPNLVVVCESPASDAEMRAIFADLDALIRAEPSVGAYDQTI